MSSINRVTNIVWLLLLVQIHHNNHHVHSSGGDQLILAHVLHRHGDRNILKPYPSDPFRSRRYWPGGFGALTNTGKNQAMELGRFLHERYRNLIGDNPDRVYYRSSSRARTIDTAKYCAHGLFPQSRNEEHLRKPIHIDRDKRLGPSQKCPRSEHLLKKYLKSQKIRKILRKYRNLIKFIEKNSKKSLHKLSNIADIYDTLHVERLKGFKLPEWAIQALQSDDILKYLVRVHFESYTHTTELKKLNAGYLLKEILDDFHERTKPKSRSDVNLWIYSTHDLNIANILNALNLSFIDLPPYASSMHFELYNNSGRYFIQIFYRSPTHHGPQTLNIPKCGTWCPLAKFQHLYKRILPTKNFDSACKL